MAFNKESITDVGICTTVALEWYNLWKQRFVATSREKCITYHTPSWVPSAQRTRQTVMGIPQCSCPPNSVDTFHTARWHERTKKNTHFLSRKKTGDISLIDLIIPNNKHHEKPQQWTRGGWKRLLQMVAMFSLSAIMVHTSYRIFSLMKRLWRRQGVEWQTIVTRIIIYGKNKHFTSDGLKKKTFHDISVNTSHPRFSPVASLE